MGQMTKPQIIAELVARGEPTDRATFYADAFCEYREASDNIAEHGIIVSHPRTANPIENPYLVIRDRAAAKLERMKKVNADFLWERPRSEKCT
jgi:phage terminase small subunit